MDWEAIEEAALDGDEDSVKRIVAAFRAHRQAAVRLLDNISCIALYRGDMIDLVEPGEFISDLKEIEKIMDCDIDNLKL